MYLSDQEIEAMESKPVRAARPRLSAHSPHVWGGWMRDVITIRTPEGKKFVMAPDTHYRRFCRCGAEQKGRGDAGGYKVRPL